MEGLHHKLKKLAQQSHPNILDVVQLLQREQSVNEVKVKQLDGHWRAPACKKKYRTIDTRLRSLKDQLMNALTTMEYTDHVAELLHLNGVTRQPSDMFN